jgi:hypothetical protein
MNLSLDLDLLSLLFEQRFSYDWFMILHGKMNGNDGHGGFLYGIQGSAAPISYSRLSRFAGGGSSRRRMNQGAQLYLDFCSLVGNDEALAFFTLTKKFGGGLRNMIGKFQDQGPVGRIPWVGKPI